MMFTLPKIHKKPLAWIYRIKLKFLLKFSVNTDFFKKCKQPIIFLILENFLGYLSKNLSLRFDFCYIKEIQVWKQRKDDEQKAGVERMAVQSQKKRDRKGNSIQNNIGLGCGKEILTCNSGEENEQLHTVKSVLWHRYTGEDYLEYGYFKLASV